MKNPIAITARISPKWIKDGTVQGRYALVQQLENKFYSRIKQYQNSGKDTFEYIQKSYSYVLEGHKYAIVKNIEPNTNEYSAVWLGRQVMRDGSLSDNITGYVVKLNNTHTQEDFAGVNIEVLMHESDHLFSYFTNPKYVQRLIKVSKSETEELCYEKFFTDYFQSPISTEKCTSALKDFITNLVPKEQKIDVLQNFRYKLINEINGYNTGNKYLRKERELYPDKEYPVIFNQVQIMHLKEKLKMLSEILKETIQEERKLR